MKYLKLTSPGILLIIAIVLSGGIVLLDAFCLKPHVREQQRAAYRQQALEAQQTVKTAVAREVEILGQYCRQLAAAPQARNCFAEDGPSSWHALLNSQGLGNEPAIVWLSDASGENLAATRVGESGLRGYEPRRPRPPQDVLQGGSPDTIGGLVSLGQGTALAASTAVRDEAGGLLGRIWIARELTVELGRQLCPTSRTPLTVIPSGGLPAGAAATPSATDTFWPAGEDTLAVAWMAIDATGAPMGYFRAELPVGPINAQAQNARRMVLIVLSLSVGLIVLVILGINMLITGPVVRLLERLQKIDAEQTDIGTLTRDLHGEPLIIARRLESAFEKLAHISKTDQLTGLANRRHFEEVLECFYHQSRRYNRPMSLIAMDIDFFKAVNDSVGHQAGDELLRIVASAIEEACRKADLPARLGGDEFSILVPETHECEARSVAERILETVSSRPVRIRNLEINVTLSMGVADLTSGEIDSPDALASLADRALYAAKEMGRNRIVLAGEMDELSLGGEEKAGEQAGGAIFKKLAGLDSQFTDIFLHGIEEIVGLLEARDPNMADHARKVQFYAERTSREMGLPDRLIKRVRVAAMLHDIGMLALPDEVVLNPGELDAQQIAMMRRHPLLSVRMMEKMEFLEQEIPAVRYHHERFDGRGYPEGISGSAIPLTARILAVADVFDALTSSRTFRRALGFGAALERLGESAGSQLDPTVVEAFLSVARREGESMLEEAAGRPADAASISGARWRNPDVALEFDSVDLDPPAGG
jgi:diguanylate cyclase (GGDEF)-like protein